MCLDGVCELISKYSAKRHIERWSIRRWYVWKVGKVVHGVFGNPTQVGGKAVLTKCFFGITSRCNAHNNVPGGSKARYRQG